MNNSNFWTSFQNIFRSKLFWSIIASVVCLIPMFFPLTSETDWGSDYSMYIRQAKNIVAGVPQTQNGFIINDACIEVSGQAYSAGFPLLLAPIYALFGEDIAVFVQFQTFLLSLLGFVLFLTFRQRFGNIPALIATIFFVFSPYVIWYRTHILSEYAYILFQSLFIFVYLFRDRGKYWLFAGLLFGIALSIRGNALTFIPAIAFFELIKTLKYSKSKHIFKLISLKLKVLGGIALIGILYHIILNKVIFDTGNSTHFHFRVYSEKGGLDYFLPNIKYYLTQIYDSVFVFWHVEGLAFPSLILCIVLLIRGAGKLRGRDKLLGWIILFQGLMFISFPFQQGMRYVLPIVPLLLYVVLQGYNGIIQNRKFYQIIILLMCGAMFYSQYKGIKQVNAYTPLPKEWSPYTAHTQEGWRYIRDSIPADAIFVTAFPRVLALYTDRRAFTPCVEDGEGIRRDILAKNATYIIMNTQTNLWVPTLPSFMGVYGRALDTVFMNEEVQIYSIRREAL